MHLHQQREIRPQRLAHRPHVAHHVLLVLAMDEAAPRPGEWVPFQRGEAHLLHLQRTLDVGLDRLRAVRPPIGIDAHPLARGAAQDVVQRQLRALRHDVPHGDLQRAPRRHEIERGAADREVLEHDLRGMADVQRAAADDVLRHRLQALLDHRFLAGRYIGLAPAVQAVLGLDTAEQQVFRRARIEQERFDTGDLQLWHRLPPRRMVGATIQAPHRWRKQHAVRADHLRDHRQDCACHAE